MHAFKEVITSSMELKEQQNGGKNQKKKINSRADIPIKIRKNKVVGRFGKENVGNSTNTTENKWIPFVES